MTKHQQTRLRNLVRAITDELVLKGKHQTGEVCDLMLERHRKELIAGGLEMARAFVGECHRSILKGQPAYSRRERMQMELPMNLQEVEIPRSISILGKAEDGSEELSWIPFRDATFGEFSTYLRQLRDQSDALSRKLAAMTSVHDTISSGVNDHDETMGEIFDRLYQRKNEAA